MRTLKEKDNEKINDNVEIVVNEDNRDCNERISFLCNKKSYTFDNLCEIMDILRSENGCPWDREQTHKSIRNALIEEAYEAAEAIDEDSPEHMCEELGDVVLQSVFHAQIEKENGRFDIGDVMNGICEKLIRRHPHIFSEENALTSDKVLENWEKIKNEEKKRDTLKSRLDSVPKTFPALMRAQKISARCAKVKFDYPTIDEAMGKMLEELSEINNAKGKDELAEECGDFLFAVANYVRKLGIDAEECLNRAADKFSERMEMVEKYAEKMGKKMEECTQSELQNIWQVVKFNKK